MVSPWLIGLAITHEKRYFMEIRQYHPAISHSSPMKWLESDFDPLTTKRHGTDRLGAAQCVAARGCASGVPQLQRGGIAAVRRGAQDHADGAGGAGVEVFVHRDLEKDF